MKYLELKEKLIEELIRCLNIDIVKEYFTIINFENIDNVLLITLSMYYSSNITYIYYKPYNINPIEIYTNSITSSNLINTDSSVIIKLEKWFRYIRNSSIINSIYLSLNDLYKQDISIFINNNMKKIVKNYPKCDKFFTNDLICTQFTYIDGDMCQSIIQLRNNKIIIDIINNRDNSVGIKAGYKLFGKDYSAFDNKYSKYIIKLLALFCLKLEFRNPFNEIINNLYSNMITIS